MNLSRHNYLYPHELRTYCDYCDAKLRPDEHVNTCLCGECMYWKKACDLCYVKNVRPLGLVSATCTECFTPPILPMERTKRWLTQECNNLLAISPLRFSCPK